LGLLSDEAFGVSGEGAVEGGLACGLDCVGLTVMHLVGRHQADAGMVMILIVPIEESSAERLDILNAAEAPWKLRLVLHRLEVAFREGIVVGGVRPAVRPGDAEISEQKRRGLGSHGSTTVGMQGRLAGRCGMLGGGVIEQCREQGGAFPVGDASANDSAAEDVDNDVEVEVRPFCRPISLVMSHDQTSLGACARR
jgi:hypothetical protein